MNSAGQSLERNKDPLSFLYYSVSILISAGESF
jgi:hypothetical protein